MNTSFRSTAMALLAVATLLPSAARADHDENDSHHNQPVTPIATNQYLVTTLTTNAQTGSPFSDSNLVNPWGLSASGAGPWWVSDNGTGLSTLYTGTGAVVPLVVTIPAAKSGNVGSPTGTIFNGTKEFAVAPGKPAVFLFATEDGTISGWNPGVSPTTAIIAVNESGKGAAFKGLTAATVNIPGYVNQTLLYAADFTLGKVEVFDANFHHVSSIEHRINEEECGELPDGYAPFNVQNLGGNLFVAYAKRGSGVDELHGAGLGYVRVFSPEGHLSLRLEHGSFLNAPWGIAIAPGEFGPYTHSILVANFGSGLISAFNPISGRFQDFLRDASGKLITIPGIWAISPGNDGSSGAAISLYFTAGGADEATGTLGTITATQNPQGNDQ